MCAIRGALSSCQLIISLTRIITPEIRVICSCVGCGSLITAGSILHMHPVNGRWHHHVMSSLIGWAHTQNDPCRRMIIMYIYICLPLHIHLSGTKSWIEKYKKKFWQQKYYAVNNILNQQWEISSIFLLLISKSQKKIKVTNLEFAPQLWIGYCGYFGGNWPCRNQRTVLMKMQS